MSVAKPGTAATSLGLELLRTRPWYFTGEALFHQHPGCRAIARCMAGMSLYKLGIFAPSEPDLAIHSVVCARPAANLMSELLHLSPTLRTELIEALLPGTGYVLQLPPMDLDAPAAEPDVDWSDPSLDPAPE